MNEAETRAEHSKLPDLFRDEDELRALRRAPEAWMEGAPAIATEQEQAQQ